MNGLCIEKIRGPPGTGKTYTLLNRIADFEGGYDLIKDVCLLTYNKKLADKNKHDYSIRFQIDEKELYNVCTMHSRCFKLMGIKTDNMFTIDNKKQQKEFKDATGYKLYGKNSDLVLLSAYDWLRENLYSIDKLDLFYDIDELLKNHIFKDIEKFIEVYKEYKSKNELYDYADLLTLVYENKMSPQVPILCIDEFQDVTPLQLEIYKNWMEDTDYIYLAGDPQQNIYGYMGTGDFFDLFDGPTTLLSPTRRYGQKIIEIQRKILYDAGHDYVPDISSMEGLNTNVEYLTEGQYNTYLKLYKQNTFHLVRANYMLYSIENKLINAGIPFISKTGYSWSPKDIIIYNALLRLRQGEHILGRSLYYLIENHPASLFPTKKKKLLNILEDNLNTKYTLNDVKNFSKQQTLDINISFFKSITGDLSASQFSDTALRKYLIALKKHNEHIYKITVYVGTIHSTKGDEADTVFLHDEITKNIDFDAQYGTKRQNEGNVWNVGISRVKKNLFIINSGAYYAWPL